jgi:(1->4)-alpha-D-glucan 1-alpha-D-glucosylmutase
MRAPLSTYRLQLGPDLGFDDVRGLLPYLQQLGIGDVYLSPAFQARSGSTHGYDVTDPLRLSDALGGREAFDRLSADLRARGMGLLLDVVPNHMAASVENPWWRDVLLHGRDSRYARFFDIDWEAPGLDGKLLLPILGTSLEQVVEDGELQLEEFQGEPVLRYYETRLPLRPETASWPAGHQPIGQADLLALAGAQHYRLAFWREAATSINYRRFFDVSDLAALQADDPEVFEASHRLALELVLSGQVTGLRIDHVDGLRDPKAYLDRLARASQRTYVVVEKILQRSEPLRRDWPVEGTTGYEFLDAAGGLQVDEGGARALDAFAARFVGVDVPFDFLVQTYKMRALDALFRADLDALGRRLERIAAADPDGVELSPEELRLALAEVIAALPVYRTYVRDLEPTAEDAGTIGQAIGAAEARAPSQAQPALRFLRQVLLLQDVDALTDQQARERLELVLRWQQLTGPVEAKGVEDTALYVHNVLISRNEVGSDPAQEAVSASQFHRSCQLRQRDWPLGLSATSTHDTKRSEDARARISVLSELSGEWAELVEQTAAASRAYRSEIDGFPAPDPNEELLLYETLVGTWPVYQEAGEEYAERIAAYVLKAAREAKVHTSWLDPSEPYERALTGFARALLADASFRERFTPFVERVAWYGALSSVGQVVLKVAAPGVPDFYQGTELWNLRLVDPDNRGPVDFDLRARLLAELPAFDDGSLLRDFRDGRVKLFVTARALALRAAEAAVFRDGGYQPLHPRGTRARHLCAFARTAYGRWVIAVVPRLCTRLAPPEVPPVGEAVWADDVIALPDEAPRAYRDAFTGRVVEGDGALRVADVLQRLPFALLGPA